MAPPGSGRSYYLHALIVAITVVFIFFLSLLLPSKSGGSSSSSVKVVMVERSEGSRKMVIGSKPPACVNKCMNCRPCMATLVVPNHQKRKKATFKKVVSSRGEDDTYYLLSWKCRCGNKLYQP
ncbi:Epidermal patterning factor protein [Sesbania bispinosa]|nr:Epidermal patterning factor protein [Sesbania bispinosa]